jgi:hypothetical protein
MLPGLRLVAVDDLTREVHDDDQRVVEILLLLLPEDVREDRHEVAALRLRSSAAAVGQLELVVAAQHCQRAQAPLHGTRRSTRCFSSAALAVNKRSACSVRTASGSSLRPCADAAHDVCVDRTQQRLVVLPQVIRDIAGSM